MQEWSDEGLNGPSQELAFFDQQKFEGGLSDRLLRQVDIESPNQPIVSQQGCSPMAKWLPRG